MSKDALKLHVQALPSQPGVYQFYDSQERIIYVGKAKNLKNRVSSYFRKQVDSRKTKRLVKNITLIKHIVVPTESDALILENTLIKEHQPRYNILLRDDKTYPWICIKKEAFPRVFTTRKIQKDGSEYFGPFTNFKTVRLLMNLIQDLYPLRNCSYDLRPKSIETKNYKVCLEYHIGNCLGACVGEQRESNYDHQIREIRALLRGNFSEAIRGFQQKMSIAADRLDFEEAQKQKTKIEILTNYQSKSAVVSATISNVDVCSVISDEQTAYVNYLHVAYGSIVRFHNMEIKKKLEESDEDVLRVVVVELRRRFASTSKDVILPVSIDLGDDIRVTVPKKGEKKKLLDLSLRNAKQGRLEQLKQIKISDPQQHSMRLLNQMKKDLRLQVLPEHIECFDNSNIQGSNPVAACVVFRQAKPAKKEYRHYIIKTVTGANDYASMEEVSGGAQTKILHFIDTLHIIKDNLFDTPPLFQLAHGTMNIKNKKWENDHSPIDPEGPTSIDTYYSKAYLRHLFAANEFLGKQIASIHNLGFYLWLVREARKHILSDNFADWKNKMVRQMNNRL